MYIITYSLDIIKKKGITTFIIRIQVFTIVDEAIEKFQFLDFEAQKTDGRQVQSRYIGTSARAKWPTFLPS